MSPRGDKPCIGGKIRAFPIAQFSTTLHQPSKIHKHSVQIFMFYFSNLITETIKQFVILFMMLEM